MIRDVSRERHLNRYSFPRRNRSNIVYPDPFRIGNGTSVAHSIIYAH